MLTGILFALIAIIALLSIPLELNLRFEWPRGRRNEINLGWGLGHVHKRIPLGQTRLEKSARPGSPVPRKRTAHGAGDIMALVRQRPFRQRLSRFARDLWRSVEKDNVLVTARIGLDDPADTGRLWAFIGPVSATLTAVSGASISVAPDFARETLEVDGQGNFRLIPLKLILITGGLILSPTVWRGLRNMQGS